MSITIAMVNTEMTRGGAATVAACLVAGINDCAHDYSAHLYHCENRQSSSYETGLKVPFSKYINVGLARLGGAYAVADFGVAKNIIGCTSDTDVLHVHNVHGYYLNFERLLLAWKDRPVVWTWHDMWGATGRCGSSSKCIGWKNGCPKCPKMSYYPAAWIDRAPREFLRKSALFSQMKNMAIVSPSQ
jgi:putative colanic acid biosynthesis glycosyltransferase